MPRRRGGIPDRWVDYIKIGHPIFATRFVAFKTPLAEAEYNHLLREYQRFSPDDLVNRLPDLGLVIDLTNTNRYYPRHRLTNRGVQHRKLRCVGHAVPSDAVVTEFCNVVKEFLETCPSSRSLVGVHCTHGLNRTGFLVCSYMIRRLGFRPRDAIAAFETARGHIMEREQLLERLHHTSPEEPRQWPRAGAIGYGHGSDWDSDCDGPRGFSYCDDYYDE